MKHLQVELEKAIKNYQTEKAEKIIKKQLEIDDKNIDKWLELSVVELMQPFCDYFQSLNCIHHVLGLDSHNMFAIIMECCINDFYLGGIDCNLLKKLSIIQTNDRNWLSVIKYMMAQHYRFDQVNLYKRKELLEQSVKLCDEYVYNLTELSRILVNEGNFIEAEFLLSKAIKNVKCVYRTNDFVNFTDINEFFNEHIKGTHITYINFNALKKDLEILNNSTF